MKLADCLYWLFIIDAWKKTFLKDFHKLQIMSYWFITITTKFFINLRCYSINLLVSKEPHYLHFKFWEVYHSWDHYLIFDCLFVIIIVIYSLWRDYYVYWSKLNHLIDSLSMESTISTTTFQSLKLMITTIIIVMEHSLYILYIGLKVFSKEQHSY